MRLAASALWDRRWPEARDEPSEGEAKDHGSGGDDDECAKPIVARTL